MQKIAISLLAVFIVVSLNAQPIKRVKYDDMISTADERMDLGDYYNALEWYKSAYKEIKSPDVALSMAYSYYKMRDYENAERWYSRVLEEDDDNVFIDDRYAYGKTLRALDKVPQARNQFELIVTLSEDESLVTLSQNELLGIERLPDFEPNKDVLIRFADEKINSGSGEYAPAQYDESTLYFSSFQARREIVLDGKTKDYHLKIYSSTKGDKGFDKPKELHRRINREGYHTGGVTFSNDKRRMYFTRQIIRNDVVTSSTIYVSYLGEDDWSTPEPLPRINGDWIAGQPNLGELYGDEVLFFASDMEGGIGGMDIYYASLRGDQMGQPVNLGETINTPGDDVTPHYFDGNLYFSTDRRPGLGGKDIFVSSWNGSSWSPPQNMGTQYNTQYEDYHFRFNSTGTAGYLVSNRPDEKKKKLKSATCCYDIYTFDIKDLVIDLLVGVGTEDEKPLNGATVELLDMTIFDAPQSKTEEEEYRFDFLLDADRKYRIVTSKEGFISDTSEFNTNGIKEDKSIRKKVLLRKRPDIPTYTTEIVTINEPIRLNNIYYEFDKWDILPDAEIDLNILLGLMDEYDDMVIELSSHTDAQGFTAYNNDLSQKRAESAKSWLVDQGVNEERIVAKGYGESQILNRCVNGVRCPDEEHRFNRRTEFKIISGPQTIEIKREVPKNAEGGKQSFRYDSVPIILFEKGMIDLGTIKSGDTRELVYRFTNTGTADLRIDLATACKCTEINWPTEPIPPGGEGKIVAVFDSEGMEGFYEKTIDIIANTEPIVVEAKFTVEILK